MAVQKQTQIPGTEDKAIPELSKLLVEYVEVLDARMTLTKKETAARASLLAKMSELKIDSYRDPETQAVATLEEGETHLSVKMPKVEKPKDEGEKSKGEKAA